jgi:general secretion pathway protein J
MMQARALNSWRSGFTLLEAIIALALLGIIMSALMTISGQWLASWHRGFARVQGNEAIAIALDRVIADLGSAEYIPLNRGVKGPLFIGRELSVVFVRTTLGPNARPGLDIVRIGETADKTGRLLVRSLAKFEPLSGDMSRIEQLGFSDPVVLLRAPYRLQFAYAGADGVWHSTWENARFLPAHVRLTVRDANTEQALLASTVAGIHVNAPSEVACSEGGCEEAANDKAENGKRAKDARQRR